MEGIERVSQALRRSVAEVAGSATSRNVGSAFSEMMRDLLVDTNTKQVKAVDEAGKIATGKGDLVEAIVAVSEADLSLRLVVEMRNRLLEAYQQIIRMA